MPTLSPRRARAGAWVVAGATYCWVAAGIRPFTAPMEVAVGLAEAMVAVAALRRRPRDKPSAGGWTHRSDRGWLLLLGILGAWELASYFQTPRSEHPTLSSMAGVLLANHAGRAALMAGWLLLGWVVFLSPPPARAD